MGEHKNTILAIVLSLLVVVGWQYFIGYPQMQRQQDRRSSSSRNRRKSSPAPPSPAPRSRAQPKRSAPPVPNAAVGRSRRRATAKR